MTDRPLQELRELLFAPGGPEPPLLIPLVPLLPESLLMRALQLASKIRYAPLRMQAMLALIARMPKAEQQALLAEMPPTEGGEQPDLAPPLDPRVPALLATLSEAQRIDVLAEVLEVMLQQLTAVSANGHGARHEEAAEEFTKEMLDDSAGITPDIIHEAKPEIMIDRELPTLDDGLVSLGGEGATLGGEGAFPPMQLPTQERLVNTGFALRNQAHEPLSSGMPLECAASYYFWLEVGVAIQGSIETAPVALPVEQLPPQALLTVALFAFEPGIIIEPGADTGDLQLQPDGSVKVVRQPTLVAVNTNLLRRRLFFPVKAPDKSGTFKLRCNIYYQQVLIQSRLIRARVMRHPHPLEQALRSRVDYTLSRDLDARYLQQLFSLRYASSKTVDNGIIKAVATNGKTDQIGFELV